MERCTIELHNADCMEIMARYPDGYFDLAIVDPPYGIGISGNPVRQKHAKKTWDSCIPDVAYFSQLLRISKNTIIWGGNYFLQYLDSCQCFIVWDKKQPQDFSLAMCEMAWTSFSSPAKMFRYSVHNENDKIHPTQKPVELYKWLYANYAKPGMKILDTHLGSGSNAIAAYDMNMALFVGCELDTDYYTAAKARIEQHCNQQRLF